MARSQFTLLERLMSHAAVQPDGCWLWTAYRNKKGYGVIGIGGKRTALAHRVSYELHIGPIPAGTELDHRCHGSENCVGGSACIHRGCINPTHLLPTTHRENVQRGVGIGAACAALKRAKTHCPAGHEYSPENTYISHRGQRGCRACSLQRGKARTEAKRALRMPKVLKAACIHGHPFDKENTGFYSKRRFCRQCARANAKRYQQAKRNPKL